ncbi:Asp-tRNA(Asn)/Glu-tRNA(Gln) amidotransferase subunit GatC [Bathymodiolus septemdierum thioautotrophic gill symbiont]|uniref:Aspartyl/glutamyl-tRNA(Asn/Gln) amidotransferase subunit C n=1 Tax=endosymbiont of Bathymodiolus septemdierum str. Myojin knoll TaxID=1303921 RepID=A0A0N7KBC8_9GAMM|nr:Asp-tRNA(Asn)/Glu-tRNA(Gln) amidotransferase subunit GatC [Bathymodiolus septemdierum thioautotrophic gill symbiont]BAS67655.1 aspartyl-tRNA(Asn)/glutamyl-tRNA (Gln) amidotransferase subunit C [endosymbiont of Bathymodiolus septemdierum str. Myojin knoll]
MIDSTQVKQIAYLAKLGIEGNELDKTTQELNNILVLAEQLSEIDTDGITPMSHPLHMTQRLREDEVTEVDNATAFQAIAPKTDNRHYLVPTVIE